MNDSKSPLQPPTPAWQPTGTVTVRVFGRTDVGQVREHNEDNFIVADLSAAKRSLQPDVRFHVIGPRGSLFAVCDGMGGAAAGEVASQMAVDIVYEAMLAGSPPRDRDDFARRLVYSIEAAGAQIFEAARQDRTRRGMGTTSTVAGVFGDILFLAQVGDSRGYLFRAGHDSIVQVTKDQSLVNQLIESGQLKPEDAESFEHSNIILQALGTAPDVNVDLTYVELRRGDTVLLCSDGLSGLVPADAIREVVLATPDPVEACKRLTDMANSAGGHDNITAVIARFGGEGLREPGGDEKAAYAKYTPGRRSVAAAPQPTPSPGPTPAPTPAREAAAVAAPPASAPVDEAPARTAAAPVIAAAQLTPSPRHETPSPSARSRGRSLGIVSLGAAAVIALAAYAIVGRGVSPARRDAGVPGAPQGTDFPAGVGHQRDGDRQQFLCACGTEA